MPRETILQVLMRRDRMGAQEATELIQEARKDLFERLEYEMPDASDFCAEWFGLEPDYIDDLMF